MNVVIVNVRESEIVDDMQTVDGFDRYYADKFIEKGERYSKIVNIPLVPVVGDMIPLRFERTGLCLFYEVIGRLLQEPRAISDPTLDASEYVVEVMLFVHSPDDCIEDGVSRIGGVPVVSAPATVTELKPTKSDAAG